MPNSGSTLLPVMFLWKCLFLHAGEEEEEDRASSQIFNNLFDDFLEVEPLKEEKQMKE